MVQSDCIWHHPTVSCPDLVWFRLLTACQFLVNIFIWWIRQTFSEQEIKCFWCWSFDKLYFLKKCCWICRLRVFPLRPLTIRRLLEFSEGRTNVFWYLELYSFYSLLLLEISDGFFIISTWFISLFPMLIYLRWFAFHITTEHWFK